MKQIFLILSLFASVYISAQGEFYVGLHYFKVKSEYAKEFIEAEKNYFSKIHKARIDSGDKIAWDMWKLQKNDMNDGETIFVFAHLQDINKPFKMGNPSKMFSLITTKEESKLPFEGFTSCFGLFVHKRY